MMNTSGEPLRPSDPRTRSHPVEADTRRGRPSPSASPEAGAFVDTFPAHVRLHPLDTQHGNRYRSAWQRERHPNPRPQSPALPWHKEYSQLDPKCGRVLVVDFIRADQSRNRKRKVVAQELDSLDGLRKLYRDPRRGADANLRLLHVQNAPWATKFLLRKFNIDGRDDLVGSTFGKYVKFTKPDTRGGKPFPNAKSWRVQHDPWRGVSKTSFGFEYLKEYKVADPLTEGRPADEKLMELNDYDEEENPAYGYDVYIQRLACYVQHKEDPPTPPFDGANGISNPYKTESDGHAFAKKQKEYLPQLSSLDNENAIIIFENSQSGSFEDCLIPARSEWETHWRRLPFYLAYEARDIVGNDDLLGRQCARMILDDVFRSLVARWETLLDKCQTHVSILEDKIYEQPADETRAPELWRNSSLWLRIEKLTTAHMSVVRDMRARLRELVADIVVPSNTSNSHNNTAVDVLSVLNDDDWLEEIPNDFERIATTVEEDLVKPTQALISLLYQSVSIRDSRLSLQIDTSTWRLSWITFIFLPLTFMVGFFGMNVNTFANDPSIKWYFVVSVPFMLLVLAAWYITKHVLARQRQTPYQRGIYESFFHDLAVTYPILWSRVGPRDYIVPRTRLDRWKWWLIKRWTRPERTIKAGQANADAAGPDHLSRWSKCKRYLIRKWTGEITTFMTKIADQQLLDGDDDTDLEQGQGNVIVDGLLGATEMLTVPGQPIASAALERLEQLKRLQRLQQQEGDVVRPDEDVAIQVLTTEELPLPFVNANIRFERGLSPPVPPRAASGSPRGRRPNSSGAGSSGSRNSSVLVEEEDPIWINQCAKEGKGGWYWRGVGSQSHSVSPSPAGRAIGGVGDKRRTSSGGSVGVSGRVFRRGIDERVGLVVGGAGGEGGAGVVVARGSSPLGVMTNIGDERSDKSTDHGIEGLGIADGHGEGEGDGAEGSFNAAESSGSEPERAAEETAGRDNDNLEHKKDGHKRKEKEEANEKENQR
ncbi:hypothetical protein GJ744_012360 [Endocarpon pusillum]|uniref:Uncharacterized protein n=1 Tax=Endocarpon pusillum TaxID=364733 RepID=A0A8H7ABC4_9EURO|nr:hypothetical protein GJ744_012360 [Endocarpon pusillum]